MSKRISVLSTLGRAITQPTSALASELANPVRGLFLRSKRIPKFAAVPRPLKLGRKADAPALIAGLFSFKGQTFDTGPTGEPWTLPVPSESFARELHRFEWLFALAAQNDVPARHRAQLLTDSWIAVYGSWNNFAWQPDILTDRLFALMANWKVLLSTDDAAEQTRRSNIVRQVSYLRRSLRKISAGSLQIKACATLALAGAMVADKALLDKNLDSLDDLLEAQVLGDGGHISRQPQKIFDILMVLLTLESALKARGVEGSKQTRRAIDRLGPALLFFTHSDSGLANFHGSGEGNSKAIKALIKQAGVKSKPFSYMPHSGFQRLAANGTVLLIDTGDSPPRPYDTQAHIAPLAFELSAPSGRLIVNCGYTPEQPDSWRASMRETAAHNALTLDDCSSGEIINSRLHGTAISRNAGPVTAKRKEIEGGIWLESSHDGYRDSTGLVHRRRIYMDPQGIDIRGEDNLAIPMNGQPVVQNASFPFALRFHVHPDVRVTLARDLKSALLILSNGDGWRFRTDSGPLSIEKSVYLGRGGKPERSEQIVINGNALSDNDGEDRSNRIRWSFKRLGKLGES